MNPDWRAIVSLIGGCFLLLVAPVGNTVEVAIGFAAVLYGLYRVWYVPSRNRSTELPD
jgi:hypothetical protein